MRQILPGATTGSWLYSLSARGRRLEGADFDASQNLARLMFADGSEELVTVPIREPVVAKVNSKKGTITLRWEDHDRKHVPAAVTDLQKESGHENERTDWSEPIPSMSSTKPVPSREIIPPPSRTITNSTNASEDVPPSRSGDGFVPSVAAREDVPLACRPSQEKDDDIPPLEEIAELNPFRDRKKKGKEASVSAASKLPENSFEIPDSDCLNPAAEELFLKMEAQRNKQKEEAKKKEAAAAAKVNQSSFGLKKGFFSNTKSSNDVTNPKRDVIEVVPKKPKEEPLKLKEVQQAMKDVQKDQSWLTPDLMRAVEMKPHIMKGMTDPRIQKAIEMMQKDPEGAKITYKDDPEVQEFFKEFSALMATHFELLGKSPPTPNVPPGAPKEPSIKTSTSPSDIIQPVEKTAPTPAEMPPGVDAELVEVMQDPEIQQLIHVLRTQAVDINVFLAKRPHLFPKVKMLIDRKLLNVATQ